MRIENFHATKKTLNGTRNRMTSTDILVEKNGKITIRRCMFEPTRWNIATLAVINQKHIRMITVYFFICTRSKKLHFDEFMI